MIHAKELRAVAAEKVKKVLIKLETDLVEIAKDGWLETTYTFPKLHQHEMNSIARDLHAEGIQIEFIDNMNAIIHWKEKLRS